MVPTEIFDLKNDRFVDQAWVLWKTSLSRNYLWGDGTEEHPGAIANGTFPPPVTRSGPHPNSKWLWIESHILKWMQDQIAKYHYVPRTPANDNTPPGGQ